MCEKSWNGTPSGSARCSCSRWRAMSARTALTRPMSGQVTLTVTSLYARPVPEPVQTLVVESEGT